MLLRSTPAAGEGGQETGDSHHPHRPARTYLISLLLGPPHSGGLGGGVCPTPHPNPSLPGPRSHIHTRHVGYGGGGLCPLALSNKWDQSSSEAAGHHCSERHILPGGPRGEGTPQPFPLGLPLFLPRCTPTLPGTPPKGSLHCTRHIWVLLTSLVNIYIPFCARDTSL